MSSTTHLHFGAFFLAAACLPAVALAGAVIVATPPDAVVERGKAQAGSVAAGVPSSESLQARPETLHAEEAESVPSPVRAHAHAPAAPAQDDQLRGVESEVVPGIAGESR